MSKWSRNVVMNLALMCKGYFSSKIPTFPSEEGNGPLCTHLIPLKARYDDTTSALRESSDIKFYLERVFSGHKVRTVGPSFYTGGIFALEVGLADKRDDEDSKPSSRRQ